MCELSNPRYDVLFHSEGLCFTPKGFDFEWKWSLSGINNKPVSSVVPVWKKGESHEFVDYHRGNITERYVFRSNTVEQIFLVHERPLENELVIRGAVQAKGTNSSFGKKEDHWAWSTSDCEVTLGELYVYDATNAPVQACFYVAEGYTRIEISGSEMDQAVFPLTIDPEIGTDDFRISDMGPNGNTSYDAIYQAIAYNSVDDEYMVVWHADDNSGSLVDNEHEIFGQRISAVGAEVGTNDFRISNMGPDGNTGHSAHTASIAYNSTNNEYLVIWRGEGNTPPLADTENEIFGQLLGAAGNEIGNDFRISDMGPDGDASYDADVSPSVTYNSTTNEYLVVWSGDDNSGSLVNGENEIFGQRISATGVEVGTNDFRISDMGPDGNASYNTYSPATVYNSADNEYLVVWDADDNSGSLVVNEFEIYGQRISATGVEVGTNDFRISNMGPDGNSNYDATDPSVAYNSIDNEYLVVWAGDDNSGSFVDNEFEIYCQRLSSTGTELGANDIRISKTGPNGNTNYDATDPSISYNSFNNEYQVVWDADDNSGSLVDNEFEIYGQRLSSTGSQLGGTTDERLSTMGPNGNANYDAYDPSIAFNTTSYEFLVAWYGDDNVGALVDSEFEIFGQFFTTNQPVVDEICNNGLDDNGDGRIDETYPGGIQKNMLLWVKADQGFSNGVWEDQSPNGNDGTNIGSPVSVNSLNFNPGIQYDGSNHTIFTLPELVFDTPDQHIAIFCVYKSDNNSTSMGVYGNQSAISVANIMIFDGGVGTGDGYGTPVPELYGNEAHLSLVIYDEENAVSGTANSSQVYVNGVLEQSFTFNETTAGGVNTSFYLGKSGTHASSQNFNGEILEFIIYHTTAGTKVLNSMEMSKVESYLSIKYGITLPNDYLGSQ